MMDQKEYRQTRCPHGWVDVTQCEPCKTAAERDALRNEVDRLRVAAQDVTELVEALEKLARLGNGDKYGNSDGNMIARDALAKYKGAK